MYSVPFLSAALKIEIFESDPKRNLKPCRFHCVDARSLKYEFHWISLILYFIVYPGYGKHGGYSLLHICWGTGILAPAQQHPVPRISSASSSTTRNVAVLLPGTTTNYLWVWQWKSWVVHWVSHDFISAWKSVLPCLSFPLPCMNICHLREPTSFIQQSSTGVLGWCQGKIVEYMAGCKLATGKHCAQQAQVFDWQEDRNHKRLPLGYRIYLDR